MSLKTKWQLLILIFEKVYKNVSLKMSMKMLI